MTLRCTKTATDQIWGFCGGGKKCLQDALIIFHKIHSVALKKTSGLFLLQHAFSKDDWVGLGLDL